MIAYSCSYDPGLFSSAGDIALEMGDDYGAGRFWLTSNASGERVEAAIRNFIDRAGGDPRRIVAHLPPQMRLSRIEDYPEAVRSRLQELGLAQAIVRSHEASKDRGAGRKIRTVLATMLTLALLLLFVSSCTVGLVQIVCWSFNLEL